MAEAQEEAEAETEENKGGEQQQQQNNLEKSSSSSFLWRGLRLGKRVAIAGAAIVAVPAVIPTIVVGVAFAFPFGAYMAGFALTDRVMRSLLSTSSSEIGILEDGNEKGGVLKEETEAAGVVVGVDERDEPTPRSAEQKIDMWPPTTNSTILVQEGDDFGGIGIGEEKHAEERDEPTPLAAEQKIDMWPPTANSNILTEEGDDFGETGIGEERHAEEKDEPTLLIAEENIDMLSPTTNLDILTEKGDDFGGTGIGEESHAEGVTDGELEICDPEQETKIEVKHTSAIEDKDDIIEEIGMKKEGQQIQAERGVEENEERRGRDGNDKQNTNEELKILSSDNSSNGNDYVEPFEVIGKGENKKTKDEMEIQGLSAAVPEVKQYPMTAYPSMMPKGINNETDQTILSSECPAAIEKRDRTRIEEVRQPEMFSERRSGGTKDTVQDANEERVDEKDGIEPIQSSYVFESAMEQPSPEENRYEEGVEMIGLTAASRMAKDEVPSENYTEDGISAPIPKVENSSVCHSFLSAAPLECENQMAPLNLSKEYASPVRDHPSDVTDVEIGPALAVVEIPYGQDEVEREEHPLVQNEIDLSPLTINQNTPNEEGKNMDGMEISKERNIEGLRGRELYSYGAEHDTATPDLGMVQEGREILFVSGSEKSEHRDEMEEMEDEEVKVNEEQRIENLDNSSTLNDHMQRGHVNKEGADIVIELSGNETVDKKNAEEEMEIQGLATVVTEAKHHPKTTPFAAVMPDDEAEQRGSSSTSSSVAEKGNESRTQEVKQPETTLDGRTGRIEDETMDLFPTVHRSLDAVPEEREIDFELPGMSSEHASSAVPDREVEDKTVEQHLNDPNAEDEGYNIDEADVYHSFVSAVPLESESEMASSSLSTEYASAAEDISSCMTDAQSGPGSVHFHDEISYSEETIWEQIYAMRTIIGHKDALHASLGEELKALYLVTGVEPPISLNDTSDIMEISDKLMFLKYVVGVE